MAEVNDLKSILFNPLFVTFLVLFTGLFLGRLSFRGFSLGSAGVFFAGLIIGWLGLSASEYITSIGLLMFMYALGIQGGPSFFNAFGKNGLSYFLIVLTACLSGAACSVLSGYVFRLPTEAILGIYTGSLNSSSSLAILLEKGWNQSLLSSYGVVYPIGLVAVILFVQIIPAVLKKNLAVEAKSIEESAKSHQDYLLARKFLVEKVELDGRRLDTLDIRSRTGATLSRIRRRGRIIVPNAETTLRIGDVVLAVGAEESLEKVHQLLGNETHDDLEIDPAVEARQIVITNHSLHNVKLGDLGISQNYKVVITRIWRSGVELAPSGDRPVELGDTLVAVGKTKYLDRLVDFLGKLGKSAVEMDLLSMSLGLALALLVGKIGIPVPLLGRIEIGYAGAALLIGLFFGAIRRIGFLTGYMSQSAESILKELGLGLFLAGIGVKSGAGMINLDTALVLKAVTSSVFLLGASMLCVYLLSRKILKMNAINSLAAVCGGMASTPAMGTLKDMTGSEAPSFIVIAIYPLTIFGQILTSQVLALILSHWH
ncbi:MAG: TrkA C-terminal domain-containing protein [bacterium]